MTDRSLAEVAAAVRRGKESPVDLATQALSAARATQTSLNAFIALMDEQALRAARSIERRAAKRERLGILAGVPISVKDLIFTKGTPTTAGSRIFDATYGTEADAPVIARLRQAGAVIFGKTNLHEIALGVTSVNEHFGPVRNPWNLERVAGGSSGGSAAAVAARIGMASIGTDTRGSIRIPASCCGITGFKPTYGLVNTAGVVPLAPSLDHVGPMAVSAEDAALLLAAMVGRVRGNQLARDARASVKRLRVGVSSHHLENVDPAVAAAIERAIDALRPLVREVREVWVAGLEQVHAASGVVAGSEALAFHESMLRHTPDRYGPIVRQRLEGGAKHSAIDYLHARDQQRTALAVFHEAFLEVDVLIGAALPCAPPTIASQTRIDAVANTVQQLSRLNAAQNMAGVPALVLPCGFHEGLPIGMQVIGARGRDALPLSVGAAYQRVTDWHSRRARA